jgi:ketosteroid isomerase-like protein
MSATDKKHAMQAAFDALARGDTGSYGEQMADDCRWVTPGQSACSGVCRTRRTARRRGTPGRCAPGGAA